MKQINEKTISMKIFYIGRESKKSTEIRVKHPNFLVLSSSTWDDFSYKTTFQTQCQMNGITVDVGNIQILIENELNSSIFLDKLIAAGWSGEFPIPKTIYISMPGALTFYEQIEGHLCLEVALDVALLLCDAGYLTKVKEDKNALRLTATPGFRQSLQREQGAVKAFLDGWKLFGRQTILIGNQEFIFRSASNHLLSLSMRFISKSPLPHDINVLIGPNGVGKSQMLHQLVASWLRLDSEAIVDCGFTERPNLNQVVVVSYSPFELFPVDTYEDKNRRDHGVYKYFGMRGRMEPFADNKQELGKIALGRDFPKTNAAQSLIDCLADDQKYGGIKEWSNKVETMERVLKRAFSFDQAAVAVDSNVEADAFFTSTAWLMDTHVDGSFADEDGHSALERYIPITADRVANLNVPVLREHLHARLGVVFLKEGKPIHLSSGQRLFSYIVINILGAIRRNSLILVDEPELFLHPSLEIAFIRMLKSILASYGSKALVATHSLVTVREIPRDCVHVFEQTTEGIVVKTPPFETFGGDVQRISSYVFGDKALSKPYEEWLQVQLKELGSAEKLIAALGEDINEELIIQIHAMGRNQW